MKIISVEAIPVRLPRPHEQAVGTAGSPTPLARGSGDFCWSEAVQALYSIHFETALVKIAYVIFKLLVRGPVAAPAGQPAPAPDRVAT